MSTTPNSSSSNSDEAIEQPEQEMSKTAESVKITDNYNSPLPGKLCVLVTASNQQKFAHPFTTTAQLVRTLDEVFAKLEHVKHFYFDYKMDMFFAWKPKTQLSIEDVCVDERLTNAVEFLKQVEPGGLNEVRIVCTKNQRKIFDLPQIQQANVVQVIGAACSDEQLLKINAEVITNTECASNIWPTFDRPKERKLGFWERIWKRMKRNVPRRRRFNSAGAVNQLIKKYLLTLGTKNHKFWLYPHNFYEQQTILMDLEVISSEPNEYGTTHLVDSIHPEFVLMVCLMEYGVFAKRVPRGSEPDPIY